MGNNEIVVRAERVSKKFCKRLKRSLWYGVQDVTSTLLWGNKNHGGLRKDEFWAVNDISFEVKKGETLGMIGPNGSGKTTLLKMINGIFRPDRGTVTVEGKVGALIAVGAGFHPMLTGRENIYINGAILGMSKKEIDKQYDDIIEFADIGDFLDMPVNNYSSGMFVRLGFAVAVHSGPDILLVDEVLAVGDINFQSRCLNKIGKMRGKGVTTIIVSHRMPIISGFCQEVVYLNHGRVRSRGNASEVIDMYKRDMAYKGDLKDLEFIPEDVKSSGIIRFTKVEFLNENKDSVTEIKANDHPLLLRIYYHSEGYTGKVELDICIRDDNGNIFFRETNETLNKKLVIKKKSGYFDVTFYKICANNKRLLFYISLWRDKRVELFDWKRDLPLYVAGNPLSHGDVLLEVDWVVN